MRFQDIRKAKNELRTLRGIREVIKNKMYSIQAVSSQEKVQTSIQNKIQELVEKQEKIDAEIISKIEEITEKIELFEKAIQKIENPDEREVLRLYYLSEEEDELLKLEDVADRMHFSLSHVKRLHKQALESIKRQNVKL